MPTWKQIKSCCQIQCRESFFELCRGLKHGQKFCDTPLIVRLDLCPLPWIWCICYCIETTEYRRSDTLRLPTSKESSMCQVAIWVFIQVSPCISRHAVLFFYTPRGILLHKQLSYRPIKLLLFICLACLSLESSAWFTKIGVYSFPLITLAILLPVSYKINRYSEPLHLFDTNWFLYYFLPKHRTRDVWKGYVEAWFCFLFHSVLSLT